MKKYINLSIFITGISIEFIIIYISVVILTIVQYIITYFRAFVGNIFSGQRILFEEITLNKIHNIIWMRRSWIWGNMKNLIYRVWRIFATNFLLAVPSRSLPAGSGGKATQVAGMSVNNCLPRPSWNGIF